MVRNNVVFTFFTRSRSVAFISPSAKQLASFRSGNGVWKCVSSVTVCYMTYNILDFVLLADDPNFLMLCHNFNQGSFVTFEVDR